MDESEEQELHVDIDLDDDDVVVSQPVRQQSPGTYQHKSSAVSSTEVVVFKSREHACTACPMHARKIEFNISNHIVRPF